MKTEELHALQGLAEVAFAADQSKLAQINAQEQAIRSQLDGLITERGQQGLAVTPGSAALKAGANVRWHRWIDHRRESLNRDLAATLAEKARVIARVRQSFGKKEALTALVARVRAAESQVKSRRRDQTS